MQQLDEIKFVRVRQACELFGVTRSTMYRWVNEGRLPPAEKLGAATSGWRYSVLKKFMDEQIKPA